MKLIEKLNKSNPDCPVCREVYELEVEQFGRRVIEVLSLKKRKNGTVNTAWGAKTALGLGASILNLMEEHQ